MAVLPVGIGFAEEGGYQIERSLRFNSADSAYLNRTFGSPTNNLKWTWSGWVKRSTLGTYQVIFLGDDSSSNNFLTFRFSDTDKIECFQIAGGSYNLQVSTNAVFRDPSAWYHVVLIYDSANATSTDRIQIYINGNRETVTYAVGPFSQNTASQANVNARAHTIGRLLYANLHYLNGYLTEINFIDGSALDPTSFGEFNEDTGVWQPKAYTGSYGTNGFYLNFSDNSTTTTLWDDFSGNGNDWTPNNFSVTAGAGNDSLVDTPTNNCATWNPLFFRRNGNTPAFSEGNKKVAGQSSQVSHTGSTIGSSGKHYAEFLVTNGTSTITGPGVVRDYWDGGMANSYAHNYGGSYYADNGTRYYNATSDAQTAPGSNRVGIEVDFGGNEVSYYIVQSNGTRTLQGSTLTSANGIDFKGSGIFTATLHDTSARTVTAFFNSDEWWGTPTSGYTELNTQNLPEPTIVDGGEYFNAVLWTGNGSDPRNITGVGFAPDFVWGKSRSLAYNHRLYDIIRGAQKALLSNTTDAETAADDTMTAFLSDGFTVKNSLNNNTDTYVAWNWKANGAGSSNTAGTITSTVSANTDSGFSIVTYTGTGANATVGHGLGVAPSMIIVKNRDAADAWQVYHAANTANPETDYLVLNTTAATADAADRWNDTLPTSTVFSIGNGVEVNTNTEDYVAYVFAAIPGYSAFKSYTGTGSSTAGPFVYTGFRPAFVMVKAYSGGTFEWLMYDTSRNTYNVVNNKLAANRSVVENDPTYIGGAGLNDIDILSNGFKLKTVYSNSNGSGVGYIYMAFAENPFKYSLAR